MTSQRTLASLVLLLLATGLTAAAADPVTPSQYRAGGQAVTAAPDGTLFCEAEEFKVEKPAQGGWQARPWGENYYAATFANCFLSRKAFLGAPEDCDDTVASITVDVPTPGKYLVLVRYEATYRFETQFKVRVEQGGQARLDRLYGARKNLKVWAFGSKLKAEVAWSWGAVENVVWEGHDAYAELQKGPATITLTAGKQPAPQAKRNVDLVMLTTDEAQVQTRIQKEGYLPLDGWLTQAGDVGVKVSNPGAAKVIFKTAGWQEHSPYWVHMRNWKPVVIEVEPGKTTDWVDVGGFMDTLNDGQWNFQASGECKVEFGVRNAAGQIEKVRELTANGALNLVGLADMRWSRKIQTVKEAVAELVAYLRAQPVRGKLPAQTLVMAGSGILGDLAPIYGLNGANMKGPKGSDDWRSLLEPAKLAAKAQSLTPEQRNNLFVMSLGDEIGLPEPNAKAASEGFVAFLKAQGLTPKQVDAAAGDDWGKVVYNPAAKLREANPSLYYWSKRYLYHYGIARMKELTDVLRQNLPNVQVGANFSPHHGGTVHSYLGEVFKWVTCFREDGMTLPWSEDYAWQVPIGTPQMNGINLDLSRAGLRGKPERKILYYVMPHMPGNTPNMWRRLYHNALGHGMKILNLFEFDPVWAAYTENHVTGNAMYGTVLKTIRELGLYEDIIQAGHVRQAEVGLWFSETGDIWGDNEKSFGAAKRGLYIALLHQQVPLDLIVDQDAAAGTLKQYRALYLTDNHVSQASSKKIAEWVQDGGRLFATAGAGMFDEYNQPNTVMRELLGVEQTALEAPPDAKVGFLKEDLPFKNPVASLTWKQGDRNHSLVALGVRSRVTLKGAEATGTFADGAPAAAVRQVGKGETIYCAFLPSLSYFKPAIPMKPLDRGSTDDAMAHFIPTAFDVGAKALIGTAVADLARPAACSEPLVETSVIEAGKVGTAIVLGNWSGKPVPGLTLTVRIPVPAAKAELASGGKVTLKKDGKNTAFTFDMEIAGDVLILR